MKIEVHTKVLSGVWF